MKQPTFLTLKGLEQELALISQRLRRVRAALQRAGLHLDQIEPGAPALAEVSHLDALAAIQRRAEIALAQLQARTLGSSDTVDEEAKS
ncbi:MAG: hypothetical protein GX552_07850 [Chloroflexi bacterium]|jgi:hypothetical protein|nr:hypothetical protein [Chloroflexota bacterium]